MQGYYYLSNYRHSIHHYCSLCDQKYCQHNHTPLCQLFAILRHIITSCSPYYTYIKNNFFALREVLNDMNDKVFLSHSFVLYIVCSYHLFCKLGDGYINHFQYHNAHILDFVLIFSFLFFASDYFLNMKHNCTYCLFFFWHRVVQKP